MAMQKTQGGEWEEDVTNEELHPQGYQTTNAEFRADANVSDIPDAMVLSIYPEHRSQTRLMVYPGEMCFKTESALSNLEVAMDAKQRVADDRLFVQSTVNGCPALIERRYEREEMINKLRAQMRVEAMKQMSRLLNASDVYQNYLSISVEEVNNPLPEWKVNSEYLPFRAQSGDTDELDPIFGSLGEGYQTLVGLLSDDGAFVVSIRDLLAEKKRMLDNHAMYFSPEFIDGVTDGYYYTRSFAKDRLVGFAYFDYMLRTAIPEGYNPNSQKAPVVVSHGLKKMDHFCDDRTPEAGDMVFSVPPVMNDDGTFNVHTPNDPDRLVRETKTISFDEFMQLRTLQNMTFEAAGETFGESIPYQRRYDGTIIHGDVAAFFDPETYQHITRNAFGKVFDANNVLIAQPDLPAGMISTGAVMLQAPDIVEDRFSIENFIGETLSAPNSHKKILVDVTLHF